MSYAASKLLDGKGNIREIEQDMTSPPNIPTLQDVAHAAGVSTATVSRCLNGQAIVAEATRDKVMRAVEDLGYTPNFNARAMAAKRTHTIGAIIPTMENAIFARGLQAFQERLLGLGYNLLVSSSAYRPDLEAQQIRALVARGADGLLLIGYERDPTVYAYLARRSIPTVLAWAFSPTQKLTAVGFDNRVAMADLADKVLELGHRRIAYISGVIAGNDRAASRLAGVQDALVRFGLSPAEMPVIERNYDIGAGAEAFALHMQSTPRPTVVMCGNDVLAAGALSQAKIMGLRVPEDVSITGFDDIELAKILDPPLTTVHVPHRQMGRTAAEILIAMVEGDRTLVTRELPVAIAMRGSLAAVAIR